MNKLEGRTEGERITKFTMQSTNMLIKTLSIQSTQVTLLKHLLSHLHMTPAMAAYISTLCDNGWPPLPGGIAAKKDNPDRQVWNIMGDGFQHVLPRRYHKRSVRPSSYQR